MYFSTGVNTKTTNRKVDLKMPNYEFYLFFVVIRTQVLISMVVVLELKKKKKAQAELLYLETLIS
jgi:hypothetical protein